MTISAEFQCTEVSTRLVPSVDGPIRVSLVRLAASRGKDNSVQAVGLEMQVDGPAALAQFEAGKVYLVMFEPA